MTQALPTPGIVQYTQNSNGVLEPVAIWLSKNPATDKRFSFWKASGQIFLPLGLSLLPDDVRSAVAFLKPGSYSVIFRESRDAELLPELARLDEVRKQFGVTGTTVPTAITLITHIGGDAEALVADYLSALLKQVPALEASFKAMSQLQQEQELAKTSRALRTDGIRFANGTPETVYRLTTLSIH